MCSLLKNNLGEEGANSIVEVAKDKPQLITLCGLEPDQTSADFSQQDLGVGDAILLAFDLKINSVLVDLKCVPCCTHRQGPMTVWCPCLTVSLTTAFAGMEKWLA